MANHRGFRQGEQDNLSHFGGSTTLVPLPCLLVGHGHCIVRNREVKTDTDMKTESATLPNSRI